MIAAISTQAQLPGENALVLLPEAHYVTETPTGLIFADDTPLEVWGILTMRLLRQHRAIEWAIADAINFGERRYGEVYSQWVEETGLTESSLANIAWVGRRIERSRRREDIAFTYHQAVAALPPEKQDALLDRAVESGWKRYQLREAVKAEERSLAGTAQTIDGDVIEAGALPWMPTEDDLTDDARRAMEQYAPQGKHRVAFVSGWLRAVLWNELRDNIREGRWPA